MVAILAVAAASMWLCIVPLQPTRTSFVAEVKIGDRGPFRFLLDAGTTVTVIDGTLARGLGLKPSKTTEAIGSSGPVQVQNAVVDDVHIGTLTIPLLDVLIIDLPPFPSHGRLDGIIGMNVFAGRSFMIDGPRRCLDVDLPADRVNGGKQIEATEIVGRVALKSEGMNFILDSGASFTVLMSPRARRLATITGTTEMTSAGRRTNLTSGTIPQLHLGTLTLRDVPTVRAPQRDAREDALVPISLFSVVYIDAERRYVIVK